MIKNLFFSAFALLALISIFLVACTDEEEPKPKVQEEVSGDPELAPVCCRVSCVWGECSAYGDNCSCSCNYIGIPRCEGSFSSDGIPGVIIEPEFEDFVPEITNELEGFGNSHGDEAASLVTQVLSLLVQNNFELTQSSDIDAFNNLVGQLDDLEPFFSADELDAIEAVINQFE